MRRATWILLASCALAFVVALTGCPGALFNPPAGLTLEAVSTTSIRATWDPLPFAASYRLYHSPSSPATGYFLETKETTVLLEGLEPERGYYFRVTGINYAGESPFSTEESGYTLPREWPAPTGLRAEQTGSTEITVTWDPVPDAEWYSVRYARMNTTSYYLTSVHATSYEQDGLQVNESYDFEVAVHSDDCHNPWSAVTVSVR